MAPSGANECLLSMSVPDEDSPCGIVTPPPSPSGTSVCEPTQQKWGAFAGQAEDPDADLWMIVVQPLDWAD